MLSLAALTQCRQTGDWAGENIGFMFMMVTLVYNVYVEYLSQ